MAWSDQPVLAADLRSYPLAGIAAGGGRFGCAAAGILLGTITLLAEASSVHALVSGPWSGAAGQCRVERQSGETETQGIDRVWWPRSLYPILATGDSRASSEQFLSFGACLDRLCRHGPLVFSSAAPPTDGTSLSCGWHRLGRNGRCSQNSPGRPFFQRCGLGGRPCLLSWRFAGALLFP